MDILKHMNEKELRWLCKGIDMPIEASDRVVSLAREVDFKSFEESTVKLMDIKTGNEGFSEISTMLDENPQKGWIWLAISLGMAGYSYEMYKQRGISDEIFFATMGCFSRFVREHKQSYGEYGFDRAFWSYRQLSGVLYRIGTLEFEMVQFEGDEALLHGKRVLKKGDNILSIHIPSDATINSEGCHDSYKKAVAFFNEYFADYSYEYFYCESWLMAPSLSAVLSPNSKILQFQSDFEITKIFEEDNGYILWVYKKGDLAVDEFLEDTSLQRNIKAHVKAGGKIGAAEGVFHRSRWGKAYDI